MSQYLVINQYNLEKKNVSMQITDKIGIVTNQKAEPARGSFNSMHFGHL